MIFDSHIHDIILKNEIKNQQTLIQRPVCNIYAGKPT